jgi:ABC-type sulfate transport system permease subunit
MILTAAFAAMLINSRFAQKSIFVTIISLAFMVSDIALGIGTLLFNRFQGYVTTDQFAMAQQASLPFNIAMFFFIAGLCLPHW